MNTLFILSKSPFMHPETASMLKLVSKGDAILLIHDAVVILKHAPQQVRDALESLLGKEVHLYALEEDCDARGIKSDVRKVNYDGFVDLITRFDKVVH
jgi:tRNA 2-thiouridine synthesizing protein B